MAASGAEPPPKNKYFEVAANLRLLKASGVARCVVQRNILAFQRCSVCTCQFECCCPPVGSSAAAPSLHWCTAVLHACKTLSSQSRKADRDGFDMTLLGLGYREVLIWLEGKTATPFQRHVAFCIEVLVLQQVMSKLQREVAQQPQGAEGLTAYSSMACIGSRCLCVADVLLMLL